MPYIILPRIRQHIEIINSKTCSIRNFSTFRHKAQKFKLCCKSKSWIPHLVASCNKIFISRWFFAESSIIICYLAILQIFRTTFPKIFISLFIFSVTVIIQHPFHQICKWKIFFIKQWWICKIQNSFCLKSKFINNFLHSYILKHISIISIFG